MCCNLQNAVFFKCLNKKMNHHWNIVVDLRRVCNFSHKGIDRCTDGDVAGRERGNKQSHVCILSLDLFSNEN